MKNTLAKRLILAFLVISLAGIGIAAGLIWSQVNLQFTQYLENQQLTAFTNAVIDHYQKNQTLEGIDSTLRSWGVLPPLSEASPPPQPYVLVDLQRSVVIASPPYVVGEKVKKGEIDKGIQVEVDGEAVAFVLSTGQPLNRKPVDQAFLDQVVRAFWIASISGLLIAFLLGVWVSRSITRPIRAMTSAAAEIGAGRLEQQIPVSANNELGDLARAFNQMSRELANANQSRRQMTADIAHDLRNPISVIGGYLESIIDGKLEPTPERLKTMDAEVKRLQNLVEDFRTLSLADSRELSINKKPFFTHELLERSAAAFRNQAASKGISLTVEDDYHNCEVNADFDRIFQAIGNLIDNALRYTRPGGKVTLNAAAEPAGTTLLVSDTGPGIAPADLARIFERSFRVDPSREDEGSGLGLAIARSIVELHGGTVGVESTLGEGSCFYLHLPNQ